MIIAIEVDNVISTPLPNYMALSEVEYCTLIPGAKEAIDKMASLGHRILIYTCRDASLGPSTEVWLQKNKIPYNNILCNKPRFDLAIDHSVCKFSDWASVLEANKYSLNNLR
jgi:hypothetical protein